ncbi:hypothetical protein NXS19_011978 [Fusarium pseudograminearum]|nr:hypothetical protein NXS19_011978 [Fusarium pseudograminearum]
MRLRCANFPNKWKRRSEKARRTTKDAIILSPDHQQQIHPHKPKAAPYGKLLLHNQVEEVVEVADVETDPETEEQFVDEEEEEKEQSNQPPARAAKRAKTSHSRTHSSSHPSQTQAQAQSTRNTPRKMSSDNPPQTPSRKRNRRDSASSDSSLSSALSLSSPEAMMGSPSPVRRGGTGRPGPPGPDSSDAPKPRPITTRRKSIASKTSTTTTTKSKPKTKAGTKTNKSTTKQQQPSSPTIPTSNTNIHTHTHINTSNHINTDAPASATISVSADASMPGRVPAAQIFPNLPTKPKTAKNKASSAPADDARASHDNDEAFWDRRRDAQKFANSVMAQESSVRGGEIDEDLFTTPAKSTRKTRQSAAASTATTRSTRSASKRPHDEADAIMSPVAWSFQRDERDSSAGGSRAATPTLRPPRSRELAFVSSHLPSRSEAELLLGCLDPWESPLRSTV